MNILKFFVVLMIFQCFAFVARAQNVEVRVSVLTVSPPRVRVEAEQRGAPSRSWSFRQTYAGVLGLGERIENFEATDTNGARIAVRRVASGEYEAERPAARIAYETRLNPPIVAGDAAHVSWLTGERGVIVPGDLLPRATTEARFRFTLPAGWSVAAAESRNADGSFQTTDADSAIFFIGSNLRERRGRASGIEFAYVSAGDWAFTDEDAVEAITRILREHRETMGGAPRNGRALVILAPFPRPMTASRWSAETRGRTVLFLSGQTPSRGTALAQFSVQITHELFHLWIPNGFALSGEYDWFYEGFTQYQATRAAVRLGYLNFQDYLDTLAQAYDGYMQARERDTLSLVDISRRRWTGAPTLVYNKSMIVAFLYDLMLRQRTSGTRSLDDVYRELFRRYGQAAERADGNAAVIQALNSAGGGAEFAQRYVENPVTLDLAALVEPFGLRVERAGWRSRLIVSETLSRAQRDLLRKFGYNERETAPRRRN